uniref:aldehyde oxygenase (deformylating) n=1 Tax=Musa acuminata subsp. malaccensis TaxID=214687 RepID=A0A804L9Q0_MUSAM
MASRPGFLTEWPWQRLGNFEYLILVPWVARSQLWINLARFQTVRSKHLIVDKAIEFDRVDREMIWDDHIILNGIIFYLSNSCVPGGSHLPWWDVKGVLISWLVHIGPPISSVIHPFVEELSYLLLFALPFFCMAYSRSACITAAVGYLPYVGFMNYMGRCNFELVPLWMFEAFPLLKYLMYTPSYHSLHHTQFWTNYCLFMPLYDYIYGTMDMSTEKLYKNSLKGKEETPNVVHLTHLTTLQSIYHLRIGFCSKTLPVVGELQIQTWIVPRFSFQEKEVINNLIENAIIVAEGKGAKVVSLGLLNQVIIVDGSGLAAAVVLHSIPAGTDRVLLRGKPSKTSCAIALALCQRGTKVIVVRREEFVALKLCVATNLAAHLVLSDDYTPKVWLVGEGLTDQDQRKASSGTCFIPFSQFPVKKTHEDCAYQVTPAMAVPRTLENMHTCENWLPRRVMSAWRIAGIVHALEEWDLHESGGTLNDIDKVWRATLNHGFLPLSP